VNKKFLIGGGLVAIALFFFFKNRKKNFITHYSNPNIVGVPTYIL
jgi:LPXTG-motif cell wall-anchored protein